MFLENALDPDRIQRRLSTGYVDERARSLDAALARVEECRAAGHARSIAVEGNAAEFLPEIVRRHVTVDVVTDQTSAHDALNGYVPDGLTLADALAMRRTDPDGYITRAMSAMGRHVRAMLALQARVKLAE